MSTLFNLFKYYCRYTLSDYECIANIDYVRWKLIYLNSNPFFIWSSTVWRLTESCHVSSHAECPKGWVPTTHPGGALYFYNTKRVSECLIPSPRISLQSCEENIYRCVYVRPQSERRNSGIRCIFRQRMHTPPPSR